MVGTYGQSLSNSAFCVTNDSSEVSASTCSGRAQAANSSWPHSSDATFSQKTERKKKNGQVNVYNKFKLSWSLVSQRKTLKLVLHNVKI